MELISREQKYPCASDLVVQKFITTLYSDDQIHAFTNFSIVVSRLGFRARSSLKQRFVIEFVQRGDFTWLAKILSYQYQC